LWVAVAMYWASVLVLVLMLVLVLWDDWERRC
jgi:hypothetical protein